MGYKRESIATQYHMQECRDPGGTGSVTCRVSEHGTRNIPLQTDGVHIQDMMVDRIHRTLIIVRVVVVKQELNGGYHHISC